VPRVPSLRRRVPCCSGDPSANCNRCHTKQSSFSHANYGSKQARLIFVLSNLSVFVVDHAFYLPNPNTVKQSRSSMNLVKTIVT
jgi:hypothetical protein